VALDDALGHYACVCGEAEAWLVALNNGPRPGPIALPPGRWSVALATGEAEVRGATVWLPAYGGAVLQREV
jgi:hypothetical protein